MEIKSIKVLIIQGNPGDAVTLIDDLVNSRYTIFDAKHVKTYREGLDLLKKEVFDAVVIDIRDAGNAGTAVVPEIKSVKARTAVVITKENDEKSAIDAVYRGAEGCIARGSLLEMIDHETYYAVEKARSARAGVQPEGSFEEGLKSLVEDRTVDAEVFLRRAIELIGSATRVLRYSYDRLEKSSYVVKFQWQGGGVESTIGLSIPKNVMKLLITEEINELTKERFFSKIPPGIKDLMHPFHRFFTHKLDIESLLVIPHRVNGEMEGVVSFDICRSNKVNHAWTESKKQEFYRLTRTILDDYSARLENDAR